MSHKKTLAGFVSLCLLAFHADSGQSQVTLPVPGADVPQLVAVLESDRPEFEKAKACQQLAIVGDASAVSVLAALLSDEHLSTYARSALENLSAPESTEALRKACDNVKGNQLLGIIQSIGKRKDTKAIPVLARLLDSDQSAIRVAAARALGHLGTVQAAEPLRLAFERGPEGLRKDIAQAYLICAQQLVANGETKKAKLMFEQVGTTDVPSVIQQAASYQWILADRDLAGETISRMFLLGDPEQFKIALHAARRLESSFRPGPELAPLLEQPASAKQVQILELLSDIGDKRVLSAIMKSAESDKTVVRVAAINAIAKLGDESCLPMLLAAAKSSEPSVAQAAVLAIVAMSGDRIDVAVLEMLSGEDLRAVNSAIEIAAGRRIASSVPRLMQLTNIPDLHVRQRAIYAIGQTATVEHFPKLMELITQSLDDEATADVVQKSLQSAFLRMPQEECAGKLTYVMKNATQAAQVVLLEHLAVVGGPTALATVVAAAKGNVDALQDAATRVLGEWLTADAAPEIFELAQSLPKGKYQTRVLRGYIRIGRQLDMSMDQRMEVCRNALAIADRKDEKLLVLAVLRRHRSREGISISTSLLTEAGLKNQAQSTINRILEDVGPESSDEKDFVSLFDGKTLDGWKAHTEGFWRVENGAIVGGNLKTKVKQNEFLRSKKMYGDFELRLQFKLTGDKSNAGVQIRTEEIPDHHEVRGYQADLGDGWWGCLYDESRRRKVLAGPPTDQRAKPVRLNEWNDYRILCKGKRIQLWINDVQTVDFTESDPDIPQTGIIALQVHGNLINEARYRNIRIKTLR